jgi:ribosomal protein L7/L12
MITLSTKKTIQVILKDSGEFFIPITFYTGDDEMEAEKFSACLEMCVTIAESLLNEPNIVDVSSVYDVLKVNGHTPDEIEIVDWRVAARAFYAENKRVRGVKACRDATGWSLKEALTYCDREFPRPTV